MEKLYENSWAVLIGVGTFKNKKYQKKNLVEPKNDVQKIAELLKNKCDFKSRNIISIINSDGTLENIKNIFDDISPKIRKNDRLLVFYSGHGITRQLSRDKEVGFLIPHDVKPRKVGTSWATLLEFNDLVKHVTDRIIARQKLFLIDCCFSGIIEKPHEYELQRELSATDMIDAAKNKMCVHIFTASNRDEEILASTNVYPPISIFTESITRFIENANPKNFDAGFISGRIMSNGATNMVREASIRLHKSQAPQFYYSIFDNGGEFVFRQFTNEEIKIAKLEPEFVYEPLEQIIKRSNLALLFQDENILSIKRLVESKFGADYSLLQLQNFVREIILGNKGVQQELDKLRKIESIPEGKIEDVLKYSVDTIVSLGIRKNDFSPKLIEVVEDAQGKERVRGEQNE